MRSLIDYSDKLPAESFDSTSDIKLTEVEHASPFLSSTRDLNEDNSLELSNNEEKDDSYQNHTYKTFLQIEDLKNVRFVYFFIF